MLVYLAALTLLPAMATSGPCTLDTRSQAGWRERCDAALRTETDPVARAEMLFGSAYDHVEKNEPFVARTELLEGTKLDPNNVRVWHELGYVEVDLGNYAEGEAALDRAIALKPDDPSNFSERAFARSGQAKFEGAYADTDRVISLGNRGAEAYLMRARAALWLGKFDVARRDLDRARELGEQAKNVARLEAIIEAWTTKSSPAAAITACADGEKQDFASPGLIGNCSAAFLTERDPVKRAEYLTTRAIAWLVIAQDQSSSLKDKQIAVVLDPASEKWHANLGFDHLASRHSWAAERAFTRSIEAKPTPIALAGRAWARLNLQKNDEAEADSIRAVALERNEATLRARGDVARALGDMKTARLYWLAAYQSGWRGEDMEQTFALVGITDPAKEPKVALPTP